MSSAPDRVVHILGGRGGVGGAERVLAGLLHHGQTLGRTQLVLAPFAQSSALDGLRELVPDVHVAAGGAARWLQLPATRRWLLSSLEEFRPGLVHVHLFHAAVLTASLRRTRLPATVLTHHHGPLLAHYGGRLEARLDRWAGRRFDHVVAVSNHVAAFLRDDYGYDHVKVIPNGWIGRPLARSADPESLLFLCVANLRREKNHDDLLVAFAKVRATHPGARLRLVGSGPRQRELANLAIVLGIEDHVEFTGTVTDVWSHLAEADVVVVPSLIETQGLAALEAMAAGCPVVATRVGGLPELIVHEETGLLVPTRDPAQLAAAMMRLAEDPSLRRTLGAAGRARADRWHISSTLADYEDLYRQLVAEDHQSPWGP